MESRIKYIPYSMLPIWPYIQPTILIGLYLHYYSCLEENVSALSCDRFSQERFNLAHTWHNNALYCIVCVCNCICIVIIDQILYFVPALYMVFLNRRRFEYRHFTRNGEENILVLGLYYNTLVTYHILSILYAILQHIVASTVWEILQDIMKNYRYIIIFIFQHLTINCYKYYFLFDYR